MSSIKPESGNTRLKDNDVKYIIFVLYIQVMHPTLEIDLDMLLRHRVNRTR